MQDRHFKVWPKGCPYHLEPLETSVFENLEVTARRFPEVPAIIYYDTFITYAELLSDVRRLAGYLACQAGIEADDRVVLYLQNSPQFIIGFYAILAANAVVVPVNPMNRTEELKHMVNDTEARVIIAGEERIDEAAPQIGNSRAERLIAVHYRDYIHQKTDLELPEVVTEVRIPFSGDRFIAWDEALAHGSQAPLHRRRPDAWCAIPYSSGTTGPPKGCLHTHASTNAVTKAYGHWFAIPATSAILVTLPLYHVTGMQNSMLVPFLNGLTVVLMTRWHRDTALKLIERYRIVHWRSITTMVIDVLSHPELDLYDLTSLTGIGGGGAQMPAAVAHKLKARTGIEYVEGYGLTETMAPTHMNPPHAAKPQCLGIPIFDVDSRIIDPETRIELGPGEVGEIISHGPQVFQEYWRQPEATAEVFIHHDGKQFLRTGDLGYYDEDGYFFHVDRLKRMINVAGLKVWPAEVEAMLYEHPAVQEACVIAAQDERRGEAVKAVIILHDGIATPSPDELETWCRERMAAYKVPRLFDFVDTLPRSGAGKILWRELQKR